MARCSSEDSPATTKLEVEHSSHTFVTRPGNLDDRWDGDDTYTVWIVHSRIRDVEPGHPYDLETALELQPGNIYFLVYAIYSTGDSFHKEQCGEIEFVDLFATFEEAEALADALKVGTEYTLNHNGRIYHLPWVGYFENLEEIHVSPVIFVPELGN